MAVGRNERYHRLWSVRAEVGAIVLVSKWALMRKREATELVASVKRRTTLPADKGWTIAATALRLRTSTSYLACGPNHRAGSDLPSTVILECVRTEPTSPKPLLMMQP
eukprot:1818361-Rhodomonas_salina.1